MIQLGGKQELIHNFLLTCKLLFVPANKRLMVERIPVTRCATNGTTLFVQVLPVGSLNFSTRGYQRYG
jgi:hypothetical protein